MVNVGRMPSYDAILLVSFGGPEKHEDVIPFLENVLRGRNVPRERLLEVAEHYYHFDGRSPINEQVADLKRALEGELQANGPHVPVYLGNRNWHPLLPDTLRQMASDGVRSALALVTSAWSGYSSCRQYLDNIEEARRAVGPDAPVVDKIRPFYNHPGFLETVAEQIVKAMSELTPEMRSRAELVFTAHSIPVSMAQTSGYQAQLEEAAGLVAGITGAPSWKLVYQSRSGPPSQPWLGPDIKEYLFESKPPVVVLAPLGFLSDHLEVLWDLDVDARSACDKLGITMVRASTVGAHPHFVAALRDLILERFEDRPTRSALGTLGPCPDVCAVDCCPAPLRPARP